MIKYVGWAFSIVTDALCHFNYYILGCWLNSMIQLQSVLVKMMSYVCLTLHMLTVYARKSTYILCNTLTKCQCEPVFGWRVFTMNFTSHSHGPSKPSSPELSLDGRCRKEALWNFERKTKARVRRELQKKGQFREVKFATRCLPELSHPMPAIFRER